MFKKLNEKTLENVSGGKIYFLAHSEICEYGDDCNLLKFCWFVGKDELTIKDANTNCQHYFCTDRGDATEFEKTLNKEHSDTRYVYYVKITEELHKYLSDVGICHSI